MWVLAATVKNKSFDGRFSSINKGWARTIIPSHLDNADFRRLEHEYPNYEECEHFLDGKMLEFDINDF